MPNVLTYILWSDKERDKAYTLARSYTRCVLKFTLYTHETPKDKMLNVSEHVQPFTLDTES